MAIFYTDTGSLDNLEVLGNVLVSGSGSKIFNVIGGNGGAIEVSDLTAGANVFQVSSASVDIFKITPNKEVHVSGSLIITGSIQGNGIVNINVSAGSTSNNVSQLVLSNSNNVSFGLNGSTITATGQVGGDFTFSYFNPNDAYQQVTQVIGNNSLRFLPMQAPNVQFDRVVVPIYFSQSTSTAGSATLSFYWGAYTRNGSTLSLLTNYSTVFGTNITFSATNSSLYHGIRLATAGITNTLTEGQYYVGFLCRSTTGGGAMTLQNLVISQQSSNFSGIFGQATNATAQYTRGLGQYATTTANLPASVAFSQIQGTNLSYLRPPIFYLVSQTF
jgi:hypothetical protein